jgi:HD-GYP domain-containing protein (c-di-GMP phosphodiesterase class II)
MNYNTASVTQAYGIQLNIASQPLQVIAALSALVFVTNFTLEVLYSTGTSYSHMLLVVCFASTLGVWALIECLMLMKLHDGKAFKALLVLLIGQILISIVRVVLLATDSHLVNTNWIATPQSRDRWHFVFLIPYSLVFLGIDKSIVNLFSLNERIRARNTEKQMLITLNAMAMARDNETGNHILRTQNYVRILATRLREMGLYKSVLTDDFIDLLFKAAPLHDVGKVGIPDGILHKKSSLTPEEWEIMKTHTTIGESILSAAVYKLGKGEDVVDKAILIAGSHHEKWDGSGYPRGLKGEDIPLAARLMTVADIYDALVSKRVYKRAWTHQEACTEIVRLSGSHLDPHIVKAFLTEQIAFKEIATALQD